jgi:hypothetical protein
MCLRWHNPAEIPLPSDARLASLLAVVGGVCAARLAIRSLVAYMTSRMSIGRVESVGAVNRANLASWMLPGTFGNPGGHGGLAEEGARTAKADPLSATTAGHGATITSRRLNHHTANVDYSHPRPDMSTAPPLPPQWVLDLNSTPTKPKNAALPDPPGYTAAMTKKERAMSSKTARKPPTSEEMDTLKMKKAWEVAIGPAKQLPMNAFGASHPT